MERALEDGADIIEMDIVLSRDSILLLHHYPIPSLRGRYVRRKEAGIWLEQGLTPLSVALDRLNNRTPIYLDIKDSHITAEALYAVVTPRHNNKVVVGSPKPSLLAAIKEVCPGWTINLHCFAVGYTLRLAERAKADWVNPIPFAAPWSLDIRQSFAHRVISNGYRFVPGDPRIFQKHLQYAQWGAHALSTLQPKELRTFLQNNLG